MAIESKDLLVSIKSYSRAEALPLDASEIQDSLEAAQNYAASPTAYAGQTIKALVNGKYLTYVLQPDGDNKLKLVKDGADAVNVKDYVQVVAALPQTGQEQGVVYVNTVDHKGYIWNGSAFQQIFEQVDGLGDTVQETTEKVKTIEDSLAVIQGSAETEGSIAKSLADAKAYTDTIKENIDAEIAKKADVDKVYTKEATDAAIQQAITDSGHLKRAIVDELPEASDADVNIIYMVPKVVADGEQQHYDEFMFLNGAFEKIGDTKVDLADYAKITDVETKIATAKSEAADDAAAKADAAKTAAIEAATTDAKAKADKALEDAKIDATAKADKALEDAKVYSDGLAANYEVAGAADKALEAAKEYADIQKTAAEAVAKDYTDGQIKVVNDNLNTKVTADQVNAAIVAKVGAIEDNKTVKDYVDSTVAGAVTDYTEAIVTAKSEAITEAKNYTDSMFTMNEF